MHLVVYYEYVIERIKDTLLTSTDGCLVLNLMIPLLAQSILLDRASINNLLHPLGLLFNALLPFQLTFDPLAELFAMILGNGGKEAVDDPEATSTLDDYQHRSLSK